MENQIQFYRSGDEKLDGSLDIELMSRLSGVSQ